MPNLRFGSPCSLGSLARSAAVVLRTSERYARVSQTEGLAQARPGYVRTPTRTLGCLRRPGAARACVCVNSATSLTSTAPIWLLNPCSSKRQRNAHALPLARPTPKGSASLRSRPTSELRGLPGQANKVDSSGFNLVPAAALVNCAPTASPARSAAVGCYR